MIFAVKGGRVCIKKGPLGEKKPPKDIGEKNPAAFIWWGKGGRGTGKFHGEKS